MPESHTGEPVSHTTPPNGEWDAWTLKRAELTGQTPEEIHKEKEAGNKYAVDCLMDYLEALRKEKKKENRRIRRAELRAHRLWLQREKARWSTT